MSLRPSVPDAVAAESVARRFVRRWALRGVTLRVRPGEVVAIRGSNGSGKSTLLRIVASALRPTRGTCAVFGHDVVREAGDVRSIVGLLGHSAALYEDLTVAENLRFAARMLGLAEDPRAIAAAIDTVGLAAAADERARTLSSGMQRRVALARLMMHAPRLLLLDEPHNSLDADGIEIVNGLVRSSQLAGGATLVVSHEPERMRHLADRVVFMDAGILSDTERDESPRPANVIPFSATRITHGVRR